MLPVHAIISFSLWSLSVEFPYFFHSTISGSSTSTINMFKPCWLLAGEQDPRCSEPRLWSWEWPAANNWQANGLERCNITGDTESISGDPVDELPHQRTISRSKLRGEGGGSQPIRVESHVRTVYISNDGHGYVTNEPFWKPNTLKVVTKHIKCLFMTQKLSYLVTFVFKLFHLFLPMCVLTKPEINKKTRIYYLVSSYLFLRTLG